MIRCWESWHRGILTHYIPPMVLQSWLNSMSSCGSHSVCCLVALKGWRHLHLPPNAYDPVDIHIHYMLPEVFTLPLWTPHRKSHNFPLIHPREVLLVWHWVVAWPLATHVIILLPLPLGVGLTGVGLVHQSHAWWTPTHKGMPVSDAMRRSWLWWRMCDCLHWSCHFIGGDCWLQSDTTPHMPHLPTYL